MKRVVLILISMMLISGAANAGEWRISAVAGYTNYELPSSEICPSFSCDIDDSAFDFGVNVAYRFNKNWGIEFGYLDFGSADVLVVSRSIDVDSDALYFVGTGTHYFTEKFSITARFGVASYDVDISAPSANIGRSVSNEEEMYGLSLDYLWTPNFSTGLRFDYIDTLETESLSLTAEYIF